jgi:hypothetical protein
MGKANEPSKVENSTTRVTRLVLLMLDDVNKSFLKIKELTTVYRYCTPCPKVVKPQIQTLGLNKMVETYLAYCDVSHGPRATHPPPPFYLWGSDKPPF